MLLQMVQSKQGWDIQTAALPLSAEIDEDLNPLYTLKDSKEKRLLRLEDIQELQKHL